MLTAGRRWRVRTAHLALAPVIAVASFLGFWLAPQQTFPLVWVAPLFVLEPVAYVAGSPSLLREAVEGRLVLPLSIMSAALFTGFFWEMWNYYSLPKWIYHVPYVGFGKLFEMPVLGYLGYPFFGLIVFSWAAIILAGLFNRNLVAVFSDGSRF